ncbi:MAG: hypothetical protein NC388_05430 [Clostridium sp.]|nr:hypothetical protein [Clostridium sp.]
MKTKCNSYALCGFMLALACVGLAGCEEDENVSTLPVFSGFVITPSTPEVGQTVRVEAVQAQIGKLLYRAEYTWTLMLGDTKIDEKKSKVVYDNEPANPVYTYEIPADAPTGTYSLSFSGRYQYSAKAGAQVSGGNYEQPSTGTNGSITVVSSAALEGSCGGRVTFRVVPATGNAN